MSISAMNYVWPLKIRSAKKFVLLSLADVADDDGYCWPSITTIARKTCMDERTVQRILRSLEDYGLLKVESRFRNDGSATTNGYQLILGGDNLSPPQRHRLHQVVAIAPPPSGKTATQTTIKPLTNQKLPPDTNEASTNSDGGKDYVYPKQLTSQERDIAKSQLDAIDPVSAQAVLDELAARLNANKVTGAPLSYLRSLITRAKSGQFTPEAGIRVASAREQAKLAQLKKAAEVIKPSNPNEIPKHLAAMHQVLGRKLTSPLNQED